jgi:hypothetical protein
MCTTYFNILELCILLTEYTRVFHIILVKTAFLFLNTINRLILVAEANIFSLITSYVLCITRI